jgi:hypothetical protein
MLLLARLSETRCEDAPKTDSLGLRSHGVSLGPVGDLPLAILPETRCDDPDGDCDIPLPSIPPETRCEDATREFPSRESLPESCPGEALTSPPLPEEEFCLWKLPESGRRPIFGGSKSASSWNEMLPEFSSWNDPEKDPSGSSGTAPELRYKNMKTPTATPTTTSKNTKARPISMDVDNVLGLVWLSTT